MVWLLMIIYLGGDPTSVVDVKIVDSFQSEQRCVKRLQRIYKQAKKEGLPIPKSSNLGCTLFKRRIM
jgi:hypothetical protein